MQAGGLRHVAVRTLAVGLDLGLLPATPHPHTTPISAPMATSDNPGGLRFCPASTGKDECCLATCGCCVACSERLLVNAKARDKEGEKLSRLK